MGARDLTGSAVAAGTSPSFSFSAANSALVASTSSRIAFISASASSRAFCSPSSVVAIGAAAAAESSSEAKCWSQVPRSLFSLWLHTHTKCLLKLKEKQSKEESQRRHARVVVPGNKCPSFFFFFSNECSVCYLQPMQGSAYYIAETHSTPPTNSAAHQLTMYCS